MLLGTLLRVGHAPAAMRSLARRDASLITPCAACAISLVDSAACAAALPSLLPAAGTPPTRSAAAPAAAASLLSPSSSGAAAAASVKLVHTECGLDTALPLLPLLLALAGSLTCSDAGHYQPCLATTLLKCHHQRP